jgi:hypothetical protein
MRFSSFFISSDMRDQATVFVTRFVKASSIQGRGQRVQDEARIADAMLSQLYSDVASFVAQRKLGAVRRAAFAFAIQQALLEQKFPQDVVAKITSALVMNALVRRRIPSSGGGG